jgi:hypothetical protein
MRGKQDSVPSLQREQRLENGRRGRVRDWNNTGQQPDRLGDLFNAERQVALNDAAGEGGLVFVVNVFRRKMVLDDLVLHDAHAGLLGGEPGQWNAGIVGRKRRAAENFIHPQLGEFRVNPLGFRGRFNHAFEFFLVGGNLHGSLSGLAPDHPVPAISIYLYRYFLNDINISIFCQPILNI